MKLNNSNKKRAGKADTPSRELHQRLLGGGYVFVGSLWQPRAAAELIKMAQNLDLLTHCVSSTPQRFHNVEF